MQENPDTQTVNQANDNIAHNGDVKITGNIIDATTDNLNEGSNISITQMIK